MKTLEEVLQLLRQDSVTGAVRIEPYFIKGFDDGIIYTFTPLTDDGIKRTDRLEIHIVSNSLETLFSIDAAVRKILLTVGDEPLTANILKVNVNGGGTMEDAATGLKHLITYYYIVSNGGLNNG